MVITFVGRKEEQYILQNALKSPEAELIAVTGRRRVGKTFLVQSVYAKQIAFELTGTQDGSLDAQLKNFADQLRIFTKSDFAISKPDDWQNAFQMLREYFQNLPEIKEKRVLFIDELPWLAGPKSGFLQAFGYFWNTWASRQNLVMVICGSSASWMIKKVVNDRGGLHNRITKHINLEPFTLSETEEYLQSRGATYNRYQIVQLYMVMGGIPHYLKEIDPTRSHIQNIDRLCFSKTGLLRLEFERLYHSLFARAEVHIRIIRALAQKWQGMTRLELLEMGKFSNGGSLTDVLGELEQSGFISEYYPLDKKKKEKIYRLSDEYSLFYLHFIEPEKNQLDETWQFLSQTPAWFSWAGYAFEGICIKHVRKIKAALGISGIFTRTASYYKKGNKQNEGLQIDMVLDRNDQTINLVEIKFHNKPFALTKEYADQLQRKLWAFQEYSGTRKHVNWVFIATFGLAPNQYSNGLVTQSLALDDLF